MVQKTITTLVHRFKKNVKIDKLALTGNHYQFMYVFVMFSLRYHVHGQVRHANCHNHTHRTTGHSAQM